VHVGAAGALDERLDDVRRRPELGVSAAEIDERRPVLGGRGGDAAEEPDEVLLRESPQALRSGAHSD
jgi:hypothetical protein